MGQYYKPISIDKMQFVYSHDYANGLKLMEHSYVGNNFVAVVERLIAKGGEWFGDRIVWAGDYADPEPEHGEKNLYDLVGENKINPPDPNLKGNPEFRFMVDMDSKQFVDLEKVPVTDTYTDEKTGEVTKFFIHPIPLLTCEGNGRGGGDYRGDDRRARIGMWARHRITVQNELPEAGYYEILFDITE
jgi:hypothetical protein